MDFHTPKIPWEQTFKSFNAKEYVKILEEAKVNSLVSFTKCHHGYSYYNTKIGLRHPSLPADLDMFGEILGECHKKEMKVIAYYSVGWLTTIQQHRPQWMERNQQGQMMNTQGEPTTGPWANVCLNSPYLKEVVLPELTEIMEQYNAEGLWLDIIECQPCYCDHCQEKYLKQHGTEMPKDKTLLKDFVIQTKFDFIHACRELVRSKRPEWLFTYNTAGRDLPVVSQVDYCCIETHPGAPWARDGWAHGLLVYKYLQNIKKPWESCTSRFIHGWGGWDDQCLANMLAVSSRIAAHGGMINLGDQAHPNGTLDKELYKKIGKVFEFIEEREKYSMGQKSLPYVAILTGEFDVYGKQKHQYIGALKILSKKQVPFDLIREYDETTLTKYACLVIPEVETLSDEAITNLKAYVKNGGRLFITGRYEEQERLQSLLGYEEIRKSTYSTGYLKISNEMNEGIRKSPLMIPSSVDALVPSDTAHSLAENIDPVIEPNYDDFYIFRHAQFSPAGDSTLASGMLENHYGQGKVIYSAANLFDAYNREQQWYIKDIIGNALDRLLDEKMLILEAPSTVEINVTENDEKLVIHLIQYSIQNESDQVEEIIPAYDIKLRVRKDLVESQGVLLMPEKRELDTRGEDRWITVDINKLEIYNQVVFEKKSNT